ncbi:hypothetical protein [Streptomyces tanashiensis]|uniref:hypothetical protein n=1 Tax=Streptomyces tanashiensis TaxID=67367 RepID=UPI0033C50169
MHDHTTPTRADKTVEVDLGTFLCQAVDAVERHAEAARIAAAALALPHTHGAMAVASMTDRLLTRAEGMAAGIDRIPVCRRGDQGVGVLARWQTLKAKGPAADPLGTWSYMRDLAHLAHDMVRVLREHRAAEQPKLFVGRPSMPPLAPGIS